MADARYAENTVALVAEAVRAEATTVEQDLDDSAVAQAQADYAYGAASLQSTYNGDWQTTNSDLASLNAARITAIGAAAGTQASDLTTADVSLAAAETGAIVSFAQAQQTADATFDAAENTIANDPTTGQAVLDAAAQLTDSNADALALLDNTTALDAANLTYTQSADAANETQAASDAGADAGYQVAVANVAAGQLSATALAQDTPWSSFAAQYYQAQANWTSDTSAAFVTDQTNDALADQTLADQTAADIKAELDNEATAAYAWALADNSAAQVQQVNDSTAASADDTAIDAAYDAQSVALAQNDATYMTTMVPAVDGYALANIQADALYQAALATDQSDYTGQSQQDAYDAYQASLGSNYQNLISTQGSADVVWTSGAATADANNAIALQAAATAQSISLATDAKAYADVDARANESDANNNASYGYTLATEEDTLEANDATAYLNDETSFMATAQTNADSQLDSLIGAAPASETSLATFLDQQSHALDGVIAAITSPTGQDATLTRGAIGANETAADTIALDDYNLATSIDGSLLTQTLSDDANQLTFATNLANDEFNYVTAAATAAVGYETAVALVNQKYDTELAAGDSNDYYAGYWGAIDDAQQDYNAAALAAVSPIVTQAATDNDNAIIISVGNTSAFQSSENGTIQSVVTSDIASLGSALGTDNTDAFDALDNEAIASATGFGAGYRDNREPDALDNEAIASATGFAPLASGSPWPE